MKTIVSFLRFNVIRRLERMCSPEMLYRLLLPIARIRAARRQRLLVVPLPAILGRGTVMPAAGKCQRDFYQNRTLSYFPERLATPKWSGRCSFCGLDALREVQRQGRPAVIAMCHFGPFFLLHLWLRAAGIKAAVLVEGQWDGSPYLHRLKHRQTLFPGFPRVFCRHQLREAVEFLAAGNVLIIAIDSHSQNHLEVPMNAGARFRMATGALRLAAHQRAQLFPCTITDEGRWRFRIELGKPVPAEYFADPRNFMLAGKHLLAEMLPAFRAHPEQCSEMTLDCFRPVASNMARQESVSVSRPEFELERAVG